MNGWKEKGSQHYKTDGVEPIDLYVSGGMFLDFALGSIIKYAFRNRPGSGRFFSYDDMDKIIDYAEKLKKVYGGNAKGVSPQDTGWQDLANKLP